MPLRKRTKAREIALRFLYQWDIRGPETEKELQGVLANESKDPEVLAFTDYLIQGVLNNTGALDEKIMLAAENWELHRIAYVDRNILRLACFELLFCSEIPPKVSINEAIELGKKYSTKLSGAFINGILDKISKEVQKEEEGNGSQETEGRTEENQG